VLVPVNTIKKANRLIIRGDQYRVQNEQCQQLNQAYEKQINNLTRQTAAYDSLLINKDTQISNYKNLGVVDKETITAQKKKIRRLKFATGVSIFLAAVSVIL
jgi:hypothetical protein